jgi:hypothetical protein
VSRADGGRLLEFPTEGGATERNEPLLTRSLELIDLPDAMWASQEGESDLAANIGARASGSSACRPRRTAHRCGASRCIGGRLWRSSKRRIVGRNLADLTAGWAIDVQLEIVARDVGDRPEG